MVNVPHNDCVTALVPVGTIKTQALTLIELLVVLVIIGTILVSTARGLGDLVANHLFQYETKRFYGFLRLARNEAIQQGANGYLVMYPLSAIPSDGQVMNKAASDPTAGVAKTSDDSGTGAAIFMEWPVGAGGVRKVLLQRQQYPHLRYLANVSYFRFSPQGSGHVYSNNMVTPTYDMWAWCDALNCWSPPDRTEDITYSTRDYPFAIYLVPKDAMPVATPEMPCPKTQYTEGCRAIDVTNSSIRLCVGNMGQAVDNNVFAAAPGGRIPSPCPS